MPRDLFGDVTHPSISIGNRKWYTLPVSLISHSFAVALLLALPILAPSLLPRVFTAGPHVAIFPIVPIVPPTRPPERTLPKQPDVNPNAFPVVAPTGFTKEPDLPSFESDRPVDGGFVAGEIDLRLTEPAPSHPSAPVEPLRVGGTIRPPLKIRDAQPAYPPMAIAARIEGIVIIDTTIGVDGQVLNVRLLRSVGQLLDQAALDAVRQWQFTPSLLNGVPVPVLMTVTVRFTLK